MARPISPTVAGSPPLLTRRIVQLLLAQATFSLGWSLYLLAPKFYATELAAGPEEIGRVSAMGGVCSVLALPFALRIIDGGSRRRLFWLGCVALAGLSFGFLGVTQLGPGLYLLQGLIGIAFVFTFNATATLVADEAPPKRLGEALGLVGAANMVMNAVSTTLGESISLRFGWRSVFLLAVIASILAMAMTLAVEEAPRPPRPGLATRVSLPLRGLALPLLATLLSGATFVVMFVFYQPYALSLGAHELQDYFVGFTATAVFVRMALGNLGDRFGRVWVSCAAAGVYAVSCFSMMSLSLPWLGAYGALLGLAHGVLYPTLNAVVVDAVHPEARGRAMTVYNGAFSIGSGAAGWGCGILAQQFGYPPVFALAGGFALVAAALLLAYALFGQKFTSNRQM